jgi:hypothetical protein
VIEKISDFLISLLPSSPLFFLVYLIVFVILCVVMIFIFAKKKRKKSVTENIKKINIDDLIKIVNNKKSSNKDIIAAAMLYLENFTVEKEKNKSFIFFEKLLNHPSRSKVVFDIFHGKILPNNIKYKDKLDEIERNALNK